MNQNSTEQMLFLMLKTMTELGNEASGSYVTENKLVENLGWSEQDVRDYMDLLAERGLTTPANSAQHHCAAVSAQGRMTLRDPQFHASGYRPPVIVQGNDNAKIIVNANSTLHSVNQSITSSSYISEETVRLVEQLEDALKTVPPKHAEDVEAIAETAKTLIDHANKENPNRPLINVSAEGLKQARNLAVVAPTVTTIALKLIEILK